LFSGRHLRQQGNETRCSGQFSPARDPRPVVEGAGDSARDSSCRNPAGRGCGFCSFPSQVGICRKASAAHADPVEVPQPDRSHHAKNVRLISSPVEFGYGKLRHLLDHRDRIRINCCAQTVNAEEPFVQAEIFVGRAAPGVVSRHSVPHQRRPAFLLTKGS